MPAMAALNSAVIFWASSLASQLLQWFVLSVEARTPRTCRSRLAGEGVFEHCVDLSGLFAGKPAPTMFLLGMEAWAPRTCRSRLAGEGGLE
ncbi:hypothetical protein EMIT0P218_210028 [Pseudomonas sp. IT-P218]